MSKKVHTLFSPLQIQNYNFDNSLVVVIDVLRATSTICAALYNGASGIIPVDTIEKLNLLKKEGDLTACEKNAKKVEGYDLGNSPKEYLPKMIKNKRIILKTTNGSKCFVAAAKTAKMIVAGSFNNLSKVQELVNTTEMDVYFLCAGWKNKINMEDTLFAGAVLSAYSNIKTIECDSSLMAASIYQTHKNDLKAYLLKAQHTKRFEKLSVISDLDECLDIDKYGVLPIYFNQEQIIKLKY